MAERTYGTADRLDLDLDQTVIGNPAHDILRLALSLASAARGSNLPGVTTARILEQMIAGYEKALGYDFEGRKNRTYRPRRIQSLLEQSIRRRWRHLAFERLDSVEPVLPLGKKFWALTKEERDAIVRLSRRSSRFANALAKALPHIEIEIVKRSDQARGFVLLPKRWIVERSIA
jgi:uncharacterized protein (DUF2252 family)